MRIVLDTSATISWFIDDERTNDSMRLLEYVGAAGAAVPQIWRLEVANALTRAVRRARFPDDLRERALACLRSLPIHIDTEGAANVWTSVVDIADRFGLSIYDASYLELSARTGLPLATRDAALETAAIAMGRRLYSADWPVPNNYLELR